MEEDFAVPKKKLSPAALTGIISGGAVLIIAAALVIYFVFFRTGSLVDDWHDEDEVVQYTFYGDNKMIIGTPYGDYIGQYVYDKATRKGIITMEGATMDFTFEKNKVILGNAGILTRGKINVIRITVPPQESSEEIEMTTMPGTTPAVITTETTAAATTVPETTAAATTAAATTVPETAAVTSEATTAAETTPAVTTTVEVPTATVSMPTFTFGTMPFATMTYVFGTPIVGHWVDPAPGEWLLIFSDDGTCEISEGNEFYGTVEYEYNFFTGYGTMSLYTTDFEFQVSGDDMILRNITASTEHQFTRGS